MLRRLINGVGANLYSQIVILLTQIVLVPIMASQWGLQKYGLWLLISTIPSYLSLSDFGFATAAATRMTMEVARGDCNAARRTFQSAWFVISLASVPMALVAISIGLLLPDNWFSRSLAQSQVTEMRVTLAILIIFAVICLQGSITQAGFRCSGQYAKGTAIQSTTMLCEAIAAIVVVSVGGSFILLALTYLIIRMLALCIQAVMMVRTVPYLDFGFSDANIVDIKSLLRPALAVMALPAAQAIFLQGTTTIIGLAISASAVPIFTSTRTLTRVGIQLTTLLNHAIMPELSMAVVSNHQATKAHIVAATVIGSVIIVIPFGFGLMMLGPMFIKFWTNGVISPPYSLLLTMTIVMIINGIWHPLSNLLLAVNRQESYSYLFLIAAIVSVGISYPLALTFGVFGAGVGMLLLEIFMFQHVCRRVNRYILAQSSLIIAIRDVLSAVTIAMKRAITYMKQRRTE